MSLVGFDVLSFAPPNGAERARHICGVLGWLWVLAGCAGGAADLASLDGAVASTPAPDASRLPMSSTVSDSGHQSRSQLGPSAAAESVDASVETDAGQLDEDAGIDDAGLDARPWVPVAPECVAGEWRLAAGFLPSRLVDYIADRDMRGSTDSGAPNSVPHVISSAGMACANARERAKCEADLVLPTPLTRHLVTTDTDGVRVWQADVRPLLGLLDTEAEAVWWASTAHNVQVPCDTSVSRVDGGFQLQGALRLDCLLPDGGSPPNQLLLVTETGEIKVIATGVPCSAQ